MTNTDERQFLELKNRQFISFPPPPEHVLRMGITGRKFGISLDNEEAQAYIEHGLNVRCDEDGPFLVVTVRYVDPFPLVANPNDVSVVVELFTWTHQSWSGNSCYLESIE